MKNTKYELAWKKFQLKMNFLRIKKIKLIEKINLKINEKELEKTRSELREYDK